MLVALDNLSNGNGLTLLVLEKVEVFCFSELQVCNEFGYVVLHGSLWNLPL